MQVGAVRTETELAKFVSIDSTLARHMTTDTAAQPQKKFVPAILPWLLAAGASIIYLLTLNRWVSFNNLLQVARSSGWIAWQPELHGPLYWLVTYP